MKSISAQKVHPRLDASSSDFKVGMDHVTYGSAKVRQICRVHSLSQAKYKQKIVVLERTIDPRF